jgi:hypothetical protein
MRGSGFFGCSIAASRYSTAALSSFEAFGGT